MLKSKRFLDFNNLFYPKEYEKNDKITLKYFQEVKYFLRLDFKKGGDEQNLLYYM